MKIFPLRLLSNYDKFQNLMNITQNVHAYPSKTSKYGIEVDVNVKHYAKQCKLNAIAAEYKLAIAEIISKLKRNHG